MRGKKKAVAEIPSVIVYGEEDHAWRDPELIHIEEMTTRAELLTGNVKPHAHQEMIQLVFALSGGCDVQLDGEATRVVGPCIISIPAGVVHAFSFEEESAGWVVTAASHLVVNTTNKADAKLFADFLREPFILPIESSTDELTSLTTIYSLMVKEFQAAEFGRAVSLENLLRLLLVQIRRQLNQEKEAFSDSDDGRKLFHEFRSLVERHFRDQWPVAHYAGRLRCSQPRLNRICRRFTGRAANQIIMDRTILEARRELFYTTLSAADIAYGLGFQDPSYFSRYFKRRMGVTPGQYRAQAQC